MRTCHTNARTKGLTMFPTTRDLPVGSFDFESLGHAAATYQRSPRELLQAARELGFDAAYTQNGIGFFFADDLARAARWANREEPAKVQGETDGDALGRAIRRANRWHNGKSDCRFAARLRLLVHRRWRQARHPRAHDPAFTAALPRVRSGWQARPAARPQCARVASRNPTCHKP